MAKSKRKRGQTKQRTEWVSATTVGEVDRLALYYDPAIDEIVFETAVKDPRSVAYYERKKGEKLLFQIPAAGLSTKSSPDEVLLKDYSRLVAIDTNTDQIADDKISVVGIVLGTKVPAGLAWEVPFLLELSGIDDSEVPERVGWVEALKALLAKRLLVEGERIGVIVDHDLAAHDAINRREKPVWRKLMLPKNFSLIYASADASGSLANTLIRSADRVAKHYLERLTANPGSLDGRISVQGKVYRSRRLITLGAAKPPPQ